MSLVDIDYKIISFTRSDGIEVNIKVNLNDPTNLNENFLILKVEGIKTPIDMNLFYWIDKRRWTLNEFQYFALNNNLCIKISDKQSNILASYGICGSSNRIFNRIFGYNFN